MNSDFLDHLKLRGARLSGEAVTDFGQPSDELAAAGSATVVVPLTDYALLRVDGADATEFLHNLVTNDVRKLPRGTVQHNSLCSSKGRMLASFLLWREGDAYLLRLARDLAAGIARKLGMYVLRAKVRITDLTPDEVLIGLAGPQAEELLRAAVGTLPEAPMSVAEFPSGAVVRRAARRFELRVAAAAAPALWDRLAGQAVAVGSDAWRGLEIADGIPLITARLQEEFVPQMANFELLGGVSFQKGCYPGQEIVARTQYLGRLKRRLYRAHVAGDALPAEATPLYAPDTAEQACGAVVNAAPAAEGGFELLAVIQMSSADAGEVHLGAPDGPRLAFRALPYAVG